MEREENCRAKPRPPQLQARSMAKTNKAPTTLACDGTSGSQRGTAQSFCLDPEDRVEERIVSVRGSRLKPDPPQAGSMNVFRPRYVPSVVPNWQARHAGKYARNVDARENANNDTMSALSISARRWLIWNSTKQEAGHGSL